MSNIAMRFCIGLVIYRNYFLNTHFIKAFNKIRSDETITASYYYQKIKLIIRNKSYVSIRLCIETFIHLHFISYYLCISLGFVGKEPTTENTFLDGLKDSEYLKIIQQKINL